MSDESAVKRALVSAMVYQYTAELNRHITNGTISRQGIAQARTNTLLGRLAGESLDTQLINLLESERVAALAQANSSGRCQETEHVCPPGALSAQADSTRLCPETEHDYPPAGVRDSRSTFKGVEGPVPARLNKNTRNKSPYHPEIEDDVPLADVKALMGALQGIEGSLSPDGKWPTDPSDAEYVTAISRFASADDCFKHRGYFLAAKGYMDVMRYLLGSDHPLPGDNDENEYGIESPNYISLSIHRRFLLIKCCLGLAMCNLNLGEGNNTAKALAWLNEAEVIAKNRQYAGSSSHVWIQPTSHTLPDLFYIECLMDKAHIFDAIGNSSAYQHTGTLMGRILLTLPPWNKFAGRSDSTWLMSSVFNNVNKNKKDAPPLSQRHPDPKSDQRYQIIDSNLQVRGAWKKEYIQKEEGSLPRTYSESVFIWGGYLYAVRSKIAGGVGIRPGIPELRRISLKQRTKWEHVTMFPAVRGEGFLNRVCVDGKTMYAFSGHPQMDIFNLSTNTWTTVKTTWKPTASDRRLGVDPVWPWPKRTVSDAVAEIVNGRLYIFGGINVKFSGCNLFMELNLQTLVWRRLSGTPSIAQYDPRVPGPRMGCGSWVSPDKKKLHIFSGICRRARKGPLGDKNGPSEDWMYEDLWSWDIATETWKEERMQGNHPSPRTGMGFAFSKRLNAFLVFGGANSFVRTNVGDSSNSALYSGFYADTFMWSSPSPPESGFASSPGHWKQIQTVGFPTYRMSCHLIVDPDTEDIYLYGGDVVGDSIPSKSHTEKQRMKRKTHESPLAAHMASSPMVAEVARELGLEELGAPSYTVSFGDLWKLYVDVPGGGFEAVDMEDELRTATLGPWQRCFECRRVGFWKKCGGSCNGKAFFCTTGCQKKGWALRKSLNGCRKI